MEKPTLPIFIEYECIGGDYGVSPLHRSNGDHHDFRVWEVTRRSVQWDHPYPSPSNDNGRHTPSGQKGLRTDLDSSHPRSDVGPLPPSVTGYTSNNATHPHPGVWKQDTTHRPHLTKDRLSRTELPDGVEPETDLPNPKTTPKNPNLSTLKVHSRNERSRVPTLDTPFYL